MPYCATSIWLFAFWWTFLMHKGLLGGGTSCWHGCWGCRWLDGNKIGIIEWSKRTIPQHSPWKIVLSCIICILWVRCCNNSSNWKLFCLLCSMLLCYCMTYDPIASYKAACRQLDCLNHELWIAPTFPPLPSWKQAWGPLHELTMSPTVPLYPAAL